MNRLLAYLLLASILALLLLVVTLRAHATMPQDAVIIVLKDAKVTLKRQYRDTTGALKESLIGRYESAHAAKEAMRLLPPLKGGLMYRIDVPPAYANVVECVIPHGVTGACLDTIDHRLHFVP